MSESLGNGLDSGFWSGSEGGPCDVVFKYGSLVSGSMESLIRLLLPSFNRKPDSQFVFTFLLTSRLFLDPHRLIEEVHSIFIKQLESLDDQKKKSLSFNFLELLKEWTSQFPYDFRDEHMMGSLKLITQACVLNESQYGKNVSLLFNDLIHQLTLLESYENFVSQIKPAKFNKLICSVKAPDLTDVCSDRLIVAQQLTHIELERLHYIGPEEFLQTFIKEKLNKVSSKNPKRTNNFESYVRWFNRLSNLVASQICSHLKKKHRVRIIEFFIDIAKECFNIGNFNSLMSIIGGLNLAPVGRLKRTWAKVNKSKLEILEHQMDPTSNFTSYRSTFKAAIWRYDGAVNDREKIIVPFFTLLVKDLHFVNEGCVNKLPNNHVNFEKCTQLAQQLEKFNNWKQVACPFEKQTDVLNYLFNCPIFEDDALLLASYECEHPENEYEKEKYKSLKNET